MPIRQKIFSILMSLCILAGIIELVRRRKLKEEYSFLWLVTGILLLLLTIKYEILVKITHFIGAVLPTTTLFLFGILFLMLLCLHFSLKLSAFSTQIKNLAQKIAILEYELERKDVK